MADSQKYIDKLAHVVRVFPRDGGPRPLGMLVLQRGNRRLPLNKDIPDFSDDSTVPQEVAEMLLGMQFDNRKAVASAFNAAEVVNRRYGWSLTWEEEFELGAYCVSCLVKSKLYRLHKFFRFSEYWLTALNDAVLDLAETDYYTSHEPFPKWVSHTDDGGRKLVKPSHPQLRRTEWKPDKREFFGFDPPVTSGPTVYPEGDKQPKAWWEDRAFLPSASMWVHAINELESNAYRINPVMLETINAIAEDPKKHPPKKYRKLENEKERLVRAYTTPLDDQCLKSIRSKKRRTIEHLDSLKRSDRAQDRERRDNRQPRLADDDPRRYITTEQNAIRSEWWSHKIAVESNIEAVATKHNEFKKVRERANKLDAKPFYQRGFLDYRGRIYLSRCVISYQGGDLQRSLVEFAKGKTVRKADMKWLWIHLANTYGEKGTPDEREQAAKKLEKKFLRWGKNPVKTYKQWSDDSDDKWQCIRACIELATLKKNPKHKSTLICEIDQSTSCLQHIALIMGDDDFAERVNMGSTYHDVYSDVGTRIRQLRRLSEKHRRKIVKMAMVGWTYGGNHWSACQEYHKSDIRYLQRLSARQRYRLARDVINAIEREYPEAVTYTQGIGEGARLALAWTREDIPRLKWKTPSDFTVHHYSQQTNQYRPRVFQREKKGDETRPKYIRLTGKQPTEFHDTEKMVKSCSPNYVHSVDASIIHMLLCGVSPNGFTKPDSYDRKISCVTVHDAIGTHIRDVKRVGELFRIHLANGYQVLDPVKIATNAKTPITPRISHEWCKRIIASPYVIS